MTERTNAQINTDMFFDLLAAATKDERIGKTFHNHTVVLLPTDNPELCVSNLANAHRLPISDIIFLAMSKSKGARDYDTFQIKEPPIEI